jgi:hypothetical protein
MSADKKENAQPNNLIRKNKQEEVKLLRMLGHELVLTLKSLRTAHVRAALIFGYFFSLVFFSSSGFFSTFFFLRNDN